MQKTLLKIVGYYLFAAFVLAGCRSESDFIDNNTVKEKSAQKFYAFKDKNNGSLFGKNAGDFDYGSTFGYLAQRYDSINKTHVTGLIDSENKVKFDKEKKQYFISENKVPFIEFRLHSQVIIYDNEDVLVLYPKIDDGKVVDLVLASLTGKETELYYDTLDKNSTIFSENILAFQLAYSKNFTSYNKFTSKDGGCAQGTINGNGACNIQPVVIAAPPKGSHGYTGPRGGDSHPGGECPVFTNCDDGGGGGGGGSGENAPEKDPCEQAREPSQTATNTSKTGAYDTSKTAIKTAAASNGNENAVVLGKDANGNTISGNVQTVGATGGKVTVDVANPTAEMHTHPSENPPSPGDFYGLMESNGSFPGFTSSFVITLDDTEYALVVTDPIAAQAFLQNYPRDQYLKPKPYAGDWIADESIPLYKDYIDAKDRFMNFSPFMLQKDAMGAAMAYVADKYKMGVSLTKKDATTGNFKAITSTKNSDGSYSSNPCNN